MPVSAMRFAEKSFEVRFCAAFSAAIMPFNRNPQWFGMTQAQERISGIDTMLRHGGRLLVFQFKAKSKGKFYLEKSQWRNLARLERRFDDSTYYIFPEAEDVASAASVDCILKHSRAVYPSKVGKFFKGSANSTSASLDAGRDIVFRTRKKLDAPAPRICQEFGCFCPPGDGDFTVITRRSRGRISSFAVSPDTGTFRAAGFRSIAGIPVGDVPMRDGEGSPIFSSDEFEEMLGEGSKTNLGPGLYGLFLPHS